VPVVPGAWQSVTFDLTGDVQRVWPDMDPRDNSLNQLDFRATSRRKAPAEFFFSYLRFAEQAGYDALGVESELLARYAAEVPGTRGLVGTEISLGPHLNQYGGAQQPYDYGATSLNQKLSATSRSITDFIHANGGLSSINHPFKQGDSGSATTAQAVALALLADRAGGADILEVGYGNRDGAGLAQYLAVWDTLSRNAVFVTGNGASDDHTGQNWANQPNRFYTGAWAPELSEPALLGALSRGRAYVAQLGDFGGTVDMAVDAQVPMGAVSVSALSERALRIDVTGLPSGGAVQVLRGVVDYAGTPDPTPNTTVVQTLGPADLASGRVTPIDTTDDCFCRLQVVTATGAVVAFGQPIWLLRTPPPGGIPPPRQAAA
jgi:hypothetical protein